MPFVKSENLTVARLSVLLLAIIPNHDVAYIVAPTCSAYLMMLMCILMCILLFSCRNGFQKLDKIKDPNRQMKQLEELTGKMRECKRWVTSIFYFSHTPVCNWTCV